MTGLDELPIFFKTKNALTSSVTITGSKKNHSKAPRKCTDCHSLISVLVLTESYGDQTVLYFSVSRVITTQTMAIQFAFQNTIYHDTVRPLYTIMAYRESRGTAPLTHNLGTRRR